MPPVSSSSAESPDGPVRVTETPFGQLIDSVKVGSPVHVASAVTRPPPAAGYVTEVAGETMLPVRAELVAALLAEEGPVAVAVGVRAAVPVPVAVPVAAPVVAVAFEVAAAPVLDGVPAFEGVPAARAVPACDTVAMAVAGAVPARGGGEAAGEGGVVAAPDAPARAELGARAPWRPLGPGRAVVWDRAGDRPRPGSEARDCPVGGVRPADAGADDAGADDPVAVREEKSGRPVDDRATTRAISASATASTPQARGLPCRSATWARSSNVPHRASPAPYRPP